MKIPVAIHCTSVEYVSNVCSNLGIQIHLDKTQIGDFCTFGDIEEEDFNLLRLSVPIKVWPPLESGSTPAGMYGCYYLSE